MPRLDGAVNASSVKGTSSESSNVSVPPPKSPENVNAWAQLFEMPVSKVWPSAVRVRVINN